MIEIEAEKLRIVFDAAAKADHAGLLGKCRDHLNEDGTCRICVALEWTQHLLLEADA